MFADSSFRLLGMIKRLCFLALTVCLINGCQSSSDYQEGNPGRTSDANPYSKLSNEELAEKANAFVDSLQSLNREFREALNSMSVADDDPAFRRKQMDGVQRKYDRDFAVPARNFEHELIKRISDPAKPKDTPSEIASMLIERGQLAGADPMDMIASYIEILTKKLP